MEHARQTDREERELMDPESWDDDNVEVRQPVKKSRAVVSVAFAATDFELVAAKALEQGTTVSGYVREAALAQAKNRVTSILWSTTDLVFSMQGSTFPTTHINAPAVGVEGR